MKAENKRSFESGEQQASIADDGLYLFSVSKGEDLVNRVATGTLHHRKPAKCNGAQAGAHGPVEIASQSSEDQTAALEWCSVPDSALGVTLEILDARGVLSSANHVT